MPVLFIKQKGCQSSVDFRTLQIYTFINKRGKQKRPKWCFKAYKTSDYCKSERGVTMFNSKLMERLSDCFGPSGREKKIREMIMDEIKELADEITIDPLGNLIWTR